MDFSPSISFRVERASVHLGATFAGANQRTITLVLKLEAGEDVETAERRSLRNVEWSMSLYEGSEFNEQVKAQEAIGVFHHHAESNSEYDHSAEACYASVAIEPTTFTELWKLVANGRLPDWLSVTVKNMAYGYDPDGREKVWDVTTNRSVPITEVTFRFPVASLSSALSEAEMKPDTAAVEANLPATSSDLLTGVNRLQSAMEGLQLRLASLLRYIIGILSALLLYLLLR